MDNRIIINHEGVPVVTPEQEYQKTLVKYQEKMLNKTDKDLEDLIKDNLRKISGIEFLNTMVEDLLNMRNFEKAKEIKK